MPFADKVTPAPREVRFAGAVTALPGLASLVVAIFLVVGGLDQQTISPASVYAEAAFYLVLAASALVVAAGLVLGKVWARSPAVVLALLTIGIGWYSTGPSSRPEFGVPIMAVGVAILVLLFLRPARAWALDQQSDETEEQAAIRGGAAGRATRRDRDER